ncbi:MAG: hypothetical protein ACE5LQ_03410, partial [Candidatus Bipolaricaulia bacterium]
IAGGLQLIKALAILLDSFVPAFSAEVYRLLGLEEPVADDITKTKPFRVGPARPLLQKIELEEVKRRYAALKEGTAEAT